MPIPRRNDSKIFTDALVEDMRKKTRNLRNGKVEIIIRDGKCFTFFVGPSYRPPDEYESPPSFSA